MIFLENRNVFDEKIKVFISSKCGEKKYDEVRIQLKDLIEKTGFARVYLFEDRPASTRSAQQDYLYGLDDSDVCIFLIDNADGVSEGVLKEYQRAKAQPKKSLYIFCNENRTEPTQIQKEITYPGGPKYYTVGSFREFVDKAHESLIKDIGEIYISYCKGRLLDPKFSSSTGSIEEIDMIASESFDKQIFKNTDNTKHIISHEIYSRSELNVEKTCDLDAYSAEFLNVLFGKKSIKEFNTYFLTCSLKEMQSESLHKVVVERWNAIQHYYMNDLTKALEYETLALNLAREQQLPNWVVQDILIDLRNLYMVEAQAKNQYGISSSAQEALDREKSALFYPLLDRYEKSLYEEITNQTEKSSMISPYAVTFGNSINRYGDYISNVYIISIFNGSLTQLLRTIDRMKDVAFHLCRQYDDWEFRVLLLRMEITNGKRNELKGLISLFNDVYGKMNAEDAKRIYEFVSSNPIKYQCNKAKMLAFQYLGYYFDDDYYTKIWGELIDIINKWFNSENKSIEFGDLIFDAISENNKRLNNDQLVEAIIINVFNNNLKRFYDKAFEVISRMDLSFLSKENLTKIICKIIELIEDDTVRDNCHKIESAIIRIGKQSSELTSNLTKAVKSFMPIFYENSYVLEIIIETQDESKAFIKKYLEDIKNRNKTQGENGIYTGYADNPYKTIENILLYNIVELEQEMVSNIISACLESLYAENQTLASKVSAINLISFLRLKSNGVLFDFKSLINRLIEDDQIVFKGTEQMFLNKTTRTTLYFNFKMMKLVFNKIEVVEVLELLSSYTDLEIFEKIEALKTIISIFENGKSDSIDENVLLLILQFTLGSANDSNHDVRFYAIKALLYFISKANKGPIMKKFLSIMDYDSGFIKSQILSKSEKLRMIDKDLFAFIKEKALVDNNFVVRQRAALL